MTMALTVFPLGRIFAVFVHFCSICPRRCDRGKAESKEIRNSQRPNAVFTKVLRSKQHLR